MTTSKLVDTSASAPWLIGVQDLTVTVCDLDEAAQFFESVFGAVEVSESRLVTDTRRSRLLRTPFLNLRLVEAHYPGQRTLWPGMLDVGGWHLAGYVDDIDAAIEFLQARDVYLLGPGKKPTTNGPEVGEGSFACHCMTSWGFHFELLTYPNGRAYMDDFDDRLWNPAEPDSGATLREPAGPSIPGFRGFEHISIGVADVEEISAFLESALGCQRFYDMGPVSDPHGSGFGAYANVDVRVHVSKVRLFRAPYLNIELIEPTFPGQSRTWPNRLDVGGWALTFAVTNLEAALERILGLDVHALQGTRAETGPTTGTSSLRASLLTQFGFTFDLVEASPSYLGTASMPWNPSVPQR
jgi:catechol 2,3-dioxygenase-like lactoylglutathione lyase family enzyme